MTFSNWLRLISRHGSIGRGQKATKQKRSCALRVEALEAREVPATLTWTGLGSNNNWTTAANWAGGVPDSADDVLVFPAGSIRKETNVNNFAAGTTFAAISVEGGYVLSGNRLRLDGGNGGNGVVKGTSGVTSKSEINLIRLDLDIPAPQPGVLTGVAFNVQDGTLQVGDSVGGTISGTGGVVKDGTGTLILGRANSFNADTLVKEGVLDIRNAGLIKAGAGRLELAGANTYLGATTFAGGVLRLGNSSALGNATAATTVQDGASLEVAGNLIVNKALTLNGTGVGGAGALVFQGGTTGAAVSQPITLASNATVRTDTTAAFAGALKGAGSLTKQGPSALRLAQANPNDTGQTTVAASTLQVDNIQSLGSTAAGTIVQNGTTLLTNFNASMAEPLTLEGTGANNQGALQGINGIATFTAPVTLAGNTTVKTGTSDDEGNGGGTLNFANSISGAGELTIEQANVIFSGSAANTYTGGTRVIDGALTLNKSAGVNAIPGNLFVSGGFNSGVTVSSSDQIADTAQITINSGSTADGFNAALTVNATETVGELILNGCFQVVVRFADTGEVKAVFRSPFQKPAFKAVSANTLELNGDPVVVLSALRNGKTRVRLFAV